MSKTRPGELLLKHRTTTACVMLLLTVALLGAPLFIGCATLGGVLSLNAFAQIAAVQLFDEPNFTMALSITSAVSNPAMVTKVNWVFGDGGGFVEGLAGRTTITHQYAAPGTYQVIAYVFGPTGFVDQLTGPVTVLESPDGGTGGLPDEVPAKATGFIPAHEAIDVPVLSLLKWTAGARATSHDVYLGTDETGVTDATPADAVDFIGNQTSTTLDPADLPGETLLANTTYFWRIDEVNAGGKTKGDVKKFKTARAPTKASSPVPANGSISARVNQVLQWTAGLRTNSHDVYFGEAFADVDTATKETVDIFKGNQTGLSFDPEDEDSPVPGNLLPATMYFWRIDEVGPGGTLKGDVWSFTTQAVPPLATNFFPADMGIDISVTTNLTWDGVSSIESYDVYFGLSELDITLATRDTPEFKGNQTTKTFNPGTLLSSTDYYWRIDTLGPGGTSKGATLKFTTVALPPIVIAPFVPADFATDIEVKTDLTWTAGMGGGPTTSYDVYLSTSQTAVNTLAGSAFQINLPVGTTLFNPPTDLNANTDYFWRIVSKGPGGSRNGPVLTFRTGILPLVAHSPVPLNNAISVSPTTMLNWTAGMNAASHDVYFGTSQSAVLNATDMDTEFKGNQAGTMFDPGALNFLTDYFWRIDEVNTGGKTKGPVWKFTTGPGKAITPSPQIGQSDAELTVILSWVGGTGATSFDVYFGTDATDVTNATPLTAVIFRGNQTATNYDPPENLQAVTQYFWRIDSRAGNAVTKGDTWNFFTALGQASNPSPAANAGSQDLNVDLSWTAGAGAATHDVYFGTSAAAVNNATTADAEFQGNQAGTSYDPGLLMANTDYFWRIDEVNAGATITRKGEVWKFKTLAPPAQAANPSPANNATGVTTASPTLSWSAVATATGYDVYLDTVNPPLAQIAANQPGTSISAGVLTAGTTYFWRVDPINAAGTTTGVVWTFTTAP